MVQYVSIRSLYLRHSFGMCLIKLYISFVRKELIHQTRPVSHVQVTTPRRETFYRLGTMLCAMVLFTNNQEYEDPMEQYIQEHESPMEQYIQEHESPMELYIQEHKSPMRQGGVTLS